MTPLVVFEGALCAQVDPDLFFVEKGEHSKIRQAKAVCGACPEQAECLAQALAREGEKVSRYRHGVFGGKTPRERARIARAARQEAEL
jgi:WhiB family redox-sensing transcriptional regulator